MQVSDQRRRGRVRWPRLYVYVCMGVYVYVSVQCPHLVPKGAAKHFGDDAGALVRAALCAAAAAAAGGGGGNGHRHVGVNSFERVPQQFLCVLIRPPAHTHNVLGARPPSYTSALRRGMRARACCW
jgi:hypothetical protein